MHIPDPVLWIVGGLAAVYGADLLFGFSNVAHRTVRVVEAEKRCAQQYVIKQYIDALDRCQVAAKIGGMSAKATLGEMYFYGRGVAKDLDAAYESALPAANEGDPRAEYIVGAVLLEHRDFQSGRAWLSKAAANCHASAPPVLAASYMRAGAEDPLNAYVWNNVSNPQYAGSDLTKAVAARRTELEQRLTPEQRVEAERTAAAIRSTFDPKCR